MIHILKKIGLWNKEYLRKKGVLEESGLQYSLEKYVLIAIESLITIVFFSSFITLYFDLYNVHFVNSIVNLFFLFAMFFLLIEQKLKIHHRIFFMLTIIYAQSVALITISYYEPGLLFLFIFTIATSVFFEVKYSLISILISIFTILVFSIIQIASPFDIQLSESYPTTKWVFISANFIVIDIVFSLLVAYFLQWLKQSLHREQKLKKKLRKKSERLIEAKMKAEESDQLKSSFLANVSHEFRTPMNAIMGFTEIMLHTSPNEEKSKRYLYNIYKSAEQLLQIIHNTIEYSKIELGTIDIDKSVFVVHEILDLLLEQLEHQCPPGVVYKVYGNEYLITQRIYTDKEKLFQIFSNLILNAFKFTHDGEVGFGIMDSGDKDNHQFFVKDTGIGIRKEKQKDIFNRFHKEDDFKEGTGLGLSISATLIFHLGGKIWLESESGKGTTFYFIIPRIKKEDIK
jgi:signal transduction histidine kinase